MRAFIITILVLLAIEVAGWLYRMHCLLEGDKLPERTPGQYIFSALCGIGLIIWGLTVLQ